MSFNRLVALGLAGVALLALGYVAGSTRSRWGAESWGATLRRLVRPTLLISVVLAVAIQFVPYGRDHSNAPVVAEPSWDSAQTRDLAVAACFDCHSNETVWPWYSNVAPVSWLVQRDVEGGRSRTNWSEWGLDREDSGDESAETVDDGSMPPAFYTWLHPGARLSDDQLETLATGLEATFGSR